MKTVIITRPRGRNPKNKLCVMSFISEEIAKGAYVLNTYERQERESSIVYISPAANRFYASRKVNDPIEFIPSDFQP